MMKVSASVVAASLLMWSGVSMSQDLGVHGTLYSIEEPDSVEYLKSRFKEWEKDGTIKRKQKEAIDRVTNTIYNPKPLPNITTATESRTQYFDPTIVLDKPLTDAKGRILFPAGTTINPLHYSGLSKRYIFIDAREQKQVDFVLQGLKEHPSDKVVLTAGSWVELSQKAGKQIYFDQSGYLTRRFGINHVPAIVQQEGARLRVEERKL